VQRKEVNLSTAFITGGHAGIGFECAKQLAARSGYDLVLAGRNVEKVSIAAQRLRTAYGIKVSTLKLDTSSLSSVREAAAEFRAMLDSGETASFQALLCNAGGYFNGPPSYSSDGCEITFATNCLGHFLLLQLLIKRMENNGRIVFTASGTHDPDTADGRVVGIVAEPDAIALANDGKNGRKALSAGKRYSTSKLCAILYAYELHRRLLRAGSSISSIAFDPGAIPETGLLRTMPKPMQWLAKSLFMKWISIRVGVTQGSLGFSGASLARVASDPAYMKGSGKYFQSNNGVLTDRCSSRLSYDEQRAVKLWNDSKRLVRLQPYEEAV
jgi:NAD(P)-dependent dehydrogenase (short-subunit alcohol dehydrogenase family)